MHGQLLSFKWAGQCIRNYETEVYKRNCESNGVYGKFCRVSVKTFYVIIVMMMHRTAFVINMRV